MLHVLLCVKHDDRKEWKKKNENKIEWKKKVAKKTSCVYHICTGWIKKNERKEKNIKRKTVFQHQEQYMHTMNIEFLYNRLVHNVLKHFPVYKYRFFVSFSIIMFFCVETNITIYHICTCVCAYVCVCIFYAFITPSNIKKKKNYWSHFWSQIKTNFTIKKTGAIANT